MYVIMFCIALGAAWLAVLVLETLVFNPYIKYIKYPRMKKKGYIIEKGYLPYKPTDTIKIKEGYHNPLDAFGFFDDNSTAEMTPYGAKNALEKIISQKDKFEKCIEKSKRNSNARISVEDSCLKKLKRLKKLNKIQKFQHKLQKGV